MYTELLIGKNEDKILGPKFEFTSRLSKKQ